MMTYFPEIVEIELTRDCNLACLMCQRQVVRRTTGQSQLAPELLQLVLSQCVDRPLQINLGGLGESLLHEGLPHLFELIKQHNSEILTGFNTNGLLLKEPLFDWLLDGRVDHLTISLNAPDAAGYKWLVGSDTYDRIARQADHFLRVKGQGNKPLTSVHTFALPGFADRNRAFVERWTEIADFVQERELGNWGGVLQLDRFRVPHRQLGVCDRPWVSLAIDLDGGYHRCCASFALVKPQHSVHDICVEDYWNGPYVAAMRETMLSGEIPVNDICRNCSGRSIPANTLIERQAYSESRT